MRIALVTDAWKPQTNGVVNTLATTASILREEGHLVNLITPEPFRTLPLPTYPDIRLSIAPGRKVARMLATFQPDAIHIATEGPLGVAARRYCLRAGLPFTTSYHTRFPQYVRMRAPIPLGLSYTYLRWFHSRAERTLVATESMRRELLAHGFGELAIWTRGVDTDLFRPRGSVLDDPHPVTMYVGRVAVEKNLEDFLRLNLEGTKYVVGDGPDLPLLRQRYPAVRFLGFKFGEELAKLLASADVFVFPSKTDTFGLVMLQAMACGVPVAAYPVPGPIDVVKNGITGVLDDDLGKAVMGALALNPLDARRYAMAHSWKAATSQFFSCLAPIVEPLAPSAT